MNDDALPSANFAQFAQHFEFLTPHVNATIAPSEQMPSAHRAHYFCAGDGAVRLLRLALLASGKQPADLHKILDLPCGHGRVLRTIAAEFPHAHLTACDLLRDGVDFCAQTFHATAIYSEVHPTTQLFPDAGKYDLIFVGSLFTHLDAPRWPEFLQLFHDLLAPQGLLVFTSHGPFVAYRMSTGNHYDFTEHRATPTRLPRHLPFTRPKFDTTLTRRAAQNLPRENPIHYLLRAYEQTGFGYLDDGTGYGIALSRPSWVARQIEAFPGFRILYYLERGWDNHQDAVALVKRPLASPDFMDGHPFRSYLTQQTPHPSASPPAAPR